MLFWVGRGEFFEFIFYVTSVLLHELAHAFVAKRLGYKMSEIKLMPYGAMLVGDMSDASLKEEIIIASAGPFASILMALLTTALWWIEPTTYVYTQSFAQINFCLAIINLIPVFPLDGGRVMLGILSFFMTREKAYKKLRIVGFVGASIFACAFVVSCVFGANISLATMSAFLLLSTMQEGEKSNYIALVEKFSLQKKLTKGAKVRCVAISSLAEAKRLLGFFRKDEIVKFEVYYPSGQKRVVTEFDLQQINYSDFRQRTVGEVVNFLMKN